LKDESNIWFSASAVDVAAKEEGKLDKESRRQRAAMILYNNTWKQEAGSNEM
jgi:hypothetical protein